jgi:hypothetical protein
MTPIEWPFRSNHYQYGETMTSNDILDNKRDTLLMQELADEENIPIATLRWWRAMKSPAGPPSGKRGKRVVYRRSDIEAWKESGFDAEGGVK